MRKLKRCPWCGEAVLQLSRRFTDGLYQHYGVRCPNCSKKYIVLPTTKDSKLSKIVKNLYYIFLLFGILGWLVLAVCESLSKKHNIVFPDYFKDLEYFVIAYVVIAALPLPVSSFILAKKGSLVRSTGSEKPYKHKYKISSHEWREEERYSIVPFLFDFSVRLSINTRKQGGPIFAKKYFTHGAILSVNFKSDDAMLSQNSVPLVFEDFVFDKNTAMCRAGFVLDNRYYAGQLKLGMEFTVCEDEYILASGVITEILDRTEN